MPAQNKRIFFFNLFFLIDKSSCTKLRLENKGFTPFVLLPLVAKLLPQYRPEK